MPRPSSPSPALLPLLAAVMLAFAGCGGPRSKIIDPAVRSRHSAAFPVDVYEGEIARAHREIAVIETHGYDTDGPAARVEQLNELKAQARRLGADAVQKVRILEKKISGYTLDERTPFPSWKQGDYPLFFMRGTAILYESSLPGWVTSTDPVTSASLGLAAPPPAGDEEEGEGNAKGPAESEESVRAPDLPAVPPPPPSEDLPPPPVEP